MLVVRCNNCDSQLHYRAELAGEQVECLHCGAHLRVPFDTPDLEAIKQRSQTKVAPKDGLAPAEEPKRAEETQSTVHPVIQASTHDLYIQRQQQHLEIVSVLDKLRADLEPLSRQVRNISRLMLFATLLLAAIALGLVVMSIIFVAM